MDTATSTDGNILDFASFIKEYYKYFKFDNALEKVIGDIGLWAIRSLKFNGKDEGWHIDRGLLLVGVPGVGKDEIFRMLRSYLSYIRSPYGYRHKVVWQYAKEFMKDKVGYSCFDADKGNMYYEELALTDEGSNPVTCSRENVQHFGNRLLIGREIIQIRYNHFKQYGWQTHFSTNCNEDELLAVYGSRAMDRLYEMCNFIIVPGKSKRGIVAPTFHRNDNQPTLPAARETTVDEHAENKRILEAEYQQFLKEGTTTDNVEIHFYLLRSYGCFLGDDEDLRLLMELVERGYKEPEKQIHRADKADYKKRFVRNGTMKMAVQSFYQRLKDGGAKSIFNQVDVPIDVVIRDLVRGNKQEQ